MIYIKVLIPRTKNKYKLQTLRLTQSQNLTTKDKMILLLIGSTVTMKITMQIIIIEHYKHFKIKQLTNSN